jgi:hypothetical protein
MALYNQTRHTKLYGISNLHTWTMQKIENNDKHFDMDYDVSNVIRDYHRLFDVEYDMSHVIENSHRHESRLWILFFHLLFVMFHIKIKKWKKIKI